VPADDELTDLRKPSGWSTSTRVCLESVVQVSDARPTAWASRRADARQPTR
jgi:hypothetical protein